MCATWCTRIWVGWHNKCRFAVRWSGVVDAMPFVLLFDNICLFCLVLLCPALSTMEGNVLHGTRSSTAVVDWLRFFCFVFRDDMMLRVAGCDLAVCYSVQCSWLRTNRDSHTFMCAWKRNLVYAPSRPEIRCRTVFRISLGYARS